MKAKAEKIYLVTKDGKLCFGPYKTEKAAKQDLGDPEWLDGDGVVVAAASKIDAAQKARANAA